MSQFVLALSYTLNWEDPKREYLPVPDVGGFAIAGINSHYWPREFEEIKAASTIVQKQNLVFKFYQINFWNPMKLGGLDSQDLANRVFDEGVNASTHIAIKLLQRSLHVLEDGTMGPDTLQAANIQDPDKVLALYRTTRLNYYRRVVDVNSDDSRFFGEWEKRALA